MVHALRGKEHVEWDNPYDVGMTGLIGFSSGYYAMHRLRRAADARHRLSLPAVLSARNGARIAQVDIRPETDRAPGAGRSRPGRRRGADARRRCCRCCRRSPIGAISTQARRHYRKARQGLDELAAGKPGKRPIHPQQVAQGAQRPRGGGRGLHLRRRPADGLGRPLSRDERQAPADRLVLARLDGQRDGAGDRRAGGLSAAGRSISLSGDGGFTMLMGDFLSLVAARACR